MRLTSSEDTITAVAMGRGRVASSGSESTACRNSDPVNVGGPGRSLGKESTDEQG